MIDLLLNASIPLLPKIQVIVFCTPAVISIREAVYPLILWLSKCIYPAVILVLKITLMDTYHLKYITSNLKLLYLQIKCMLKPNIENFK